jgi:uncharacterized membrane protein
MSKEEPPKGPSPEDRPEESAADQLRSLAAVNGKPHSHLGPRLRGYFLTGLIIVGPVAITIYVVWWFISLVDGWVKPLLPTRYLPEAYLPFTVPGVGLIIAILGLMLIGALAANLFGRTLVSWGEMMLDRMPVVRGVYRTIKQIFTTIFSETGRSFKRVGLIEFPRKGLFAVVFISGDPPSEIDGKIGNGEQLITVFMPNAPNPTTGFVLFMPERDVIMLDMPIDDGIKLVVSAGLVSPDQSKLNDLAETAKRRKKPVPEEEPVI